MMRRTGLASLAWNAAVACCLGLMLGLDWLARRRRERRSAVSPILAMLACAGDVPPTPPPADTAAWVTETFDYGSTAELLASPLYAAVEDVNPQQISLAGGMRYDFPGRPGQCTDYTVGRELRFPFEVREVWIEVTATFAAKFRTAASGCAGQSNPDYKWLFGVVNPSRSRFELKVGLYGGDWSFGVPDQEEMWNSAGAAAVWDGQPHTYRLHFKVSSAPDAPDGAIAFWLDTALVQDRLALVVNRVGIYGLALGRNLNQGPDEPAFVTFQRVTLYRQDPGWER
jgi:hypothetical protein